MDTHTNFANNNVDNQDSLQSSELEERIRLELEKSLIRLKKEKENYPSQKDDVEIDLNTVAGQTESDFVFNFVKQIDKETDKNFFVSPISVKIAFAMLANGAEGNTLNQIIDTLGYSGKSVDDLNNECHNLISHWNKQNKDNEEQNRRYAEWGGSNGYQQTIETANAIWADKTFELSNGFMATTRQFYDAEFATLDFADAKKTLSLMNNWCNEKTHGMIPKMLDYLNPDAIVILANALYFKGNWEEPFNEYHTRKTDFFNGDGTVSKVKMMYQEEMDFDYVRTDSFIMAELPYNGSTCMDIILPNNGISVSRCVGLLSQTRFDAALEKMSQKKLNIHLPKFDLEFNQNLVDIMKQLGAVDAFSPTDADLSKMSKGSMIGAFISDAFQLSHISVDEEGTEAAVVTVCEETGCCPPEKVKPIEFNVNRPFAYIIRDYEDGTILFVGKVESLGYNSNVKHNTFNPVKLNLLNSEAPDSYRENILNV